MTDILIVEDDKELASLLTDFLRADCITVPVSDSIILEVKWDGFLPDIIRDAVALSDRREGAFSKYAVCRIYG